MFYQSCTKPVATLLGFIFSAIVALFPQISSASTITYNFDHEFSSGIPPVGPAPWLQAAFSDTGAGTVQLTLSTLNLNGSEFVSGWYFNLNPIYSTADLSITQSGMSGAFDAPAISLGTDSFKADGDGKYDLLFSFGTAGDASQRFTSGDTVTFTLSGITGLTAADFNFMSAPAGGHGPYVAATHVQSIDGAYSGWLDPSTLTSDGDVQVPDGYLTIILLGLGCIAVETARRRLSPAAS